MTNELNVYEINGVTVPLGKLPTMSIRSHGIQDALVILEFDDKSVTVDASRLRRAIENATNWR